MTLTFALEGAKSPIRGAIFNVLFIFYFILSHLYLSSESVKKPCIKTLIH